MDMSRADAPESPIGEDIDSMTVKLTACMSRLQQVATEMVGMTTDVSLLRHLSKEIASEETVHESSKLTDLCLKELEKKYRMPSSAIKNDRVRNRFDGMQYLLFAPHIEPAFFKNLKMIFSVVSLCHF
jgi:hypothetical protein